MWNLKCVIIPVITGAIRVITQGLKKYLQAIQGNNLVNPVQKAAILGTSHVTRKVLQSETWKTVRWVSLLVQGGRKGL